MGIFNFVNSLLLSAAGGDATKAALLGEAYSNLRKEEGSFVKALNEALDGETLARQISLALSKGADDGAFECVGLSGEWVNPVFFKDGESAHDLIMAETWVTPRNKEREGKHAGMQVHKEKGYVQFFLKRGAAADVRFSLLDGDGNIVKEGEEILTGCISDDWWVKGDTKADLGGDADLFEGCKRLEQEHPFKRSNLVLVYQAKSGVLTNENGYKIQRVSAMAVFRKVREFKAPKGVSVKSLLVKQHVSRPVPNNQVKQDSPEGVKAAVNPTGVPQVTDGDQLLGRKRR